MPVLLRSRVILFTNVGVHVARRMTTIPHQPFRAEGFKKKGFQSGDCSDSSAVGMKRVSHISAYDFRWLESTGMSNITLKSTCCEQTEWQFHPLRLIYGSSDFFFNFFLPLLLHSLCPSHQRHSHNSTTGLFSAMWLQLCLSLNLRYQTTCLLGWKNVICSQMTWNDTPISRL